MGACPLGRGCSAWPNLPLTVGRAARRGAWGLLLAGITPTLGLAAPPAGIPSQVPSLALHVDPSRVSDLSAVLARGQQADAGYRAALAGAQAAREALAQAQAMLMPSLSLSASSGQVQLDRAENNLRQPRLDYQSKNQTLALRQTIYRRNQFLQFDQAKIQATAADTEEARALYELATRLLGLYMDALYAQDVQIQVQALIRATEGQLRAAQRLFANGQGTRIDVDDAGARLDMAQAQAIQVRQQVEFALEQLRQALNEPLQGLARLDPGKNLPSLNDVGIESWLERAGQGNPTLELARLRLQTARLEADKASAGHWPTLDLTLQRTLSRSEILSNPLTSYHSTQLSLQLNVPILSGGYTQSTVRQALALSDREELQLEQTRRTLTLDIRRELQSVIEGAARVAALQRARSSAELLVASTEKGILAGTRTQTELLNALQRASEVQRDLAQARYQYLLAWGKLHLLSGYPAHEVFGQINALLTLR